MPKVKDRITIDRDLAERLLMVAETYVDIIGRTWKLNVDTTEEVVRDAKLAGIKSR